MIPGHTAFTRILWGATFHRQRLREPLNAKVRGAIGGRVWNAAFPAIEETLMIAPPCCLFDHGAAGPLCSSENFQ